MNPIYFLLYFIMVFLDGVFSYLEAKPFGLTKILFSILLFITLPFLNRNQKKAIIFSFILSLLLFFYYAFQFATTTLFFEGALTIASFFIVLILLYQIFSLI